MAKFVTRRLKTFLIILILLLVGLFAAFLIWGILEKPPAPKVIVVDTVRWNMTKPQELGMLINENVESRYEEDSEEVSVDFTVMLGKYQGNDSTRYNSLDYVTMAVFCSANVSSGYISSVDINLSRTDGSSYLDINDDWQLVEHHNLHVQRLDWKATSTAEGHVIAEATNRPDATFLRVQVDWVFLNSEVNHLTTMTLETTFFNGTAHIKTVMPIQLEVHAY